MKNLFLLLLAFSLGSCQKDTISERQARIFKVEARGTKYNILITRRLSGSTDENKLEEKIDHSGIYLYEFTPTVGQTIKVTLSGTGIESYKVSYRGSEQVSSSTKGESLIKDFAIVN